MSRRVWAYFRLFSSFFDFGSWLFEFPILRIFSVPPSSNHPKSCRLSSTRLKSKSVGPKLTEFQKLFLKSAYYSQLFCLWNLHFCLAVNKILHSQQFLVICDHWKFETFGNYLNLFNFMQDDAIQAFTFWRQILSSLSSSEMTMIKSDVGINIVIFSLSAMRWWGNWSDLCSGPQGRTVGSVAQEGRWRHCQGHSGLEGPQSHLQTHHPGTVFGCQRLHFISNKYYSGYHHQHTDSLKSRLLMNQKWNLLLPKHWNVVKRYHVQNRQAKIDVVPSAASLIVKELKEPPRDRKKVKNGMQHCYRMVQLPNEAVGRETRMAPIPQSLRHFYRWLTNHTRLFIA